MISAAIQRVLAEKSGSFLIPASKIAIVEEDNPLYANFPEQSNSSPLRKGPKPAKILYF